ncbi:MAG: hypothetical protein A3E37_03095 [Candidatus Andersenbacteria bacterium RIFCSPHIGHO2_12_FULL_46_9]|nr:MAG: Competence protein PilM [Parcubacteria group bacterium GW2011_GWA2_45_14]OGY35522.1 MAG: hypothetical protein A3B76_01975 [Candidatus Andersenbacteria bacterium RIFCSPHIGHO2_02_FULL_46_16]OGY36509.1 MAG: hypothetical protein A3I08_00830 [Candidatus Andersenbacteria bacterium RIFCSPLOWO2_02_FULL_46_11]OGY37705.1 MAG: hypothetical protein A3E37_03095 [Candidatus Andersenbacteria bacterium RIFCSPHIGHO2_12_FULL_46_9]OGY41496.1 MAG: hypothetical protein A3G57_00700 [Candidatus Andersenbacter
MIGIDLSDRSIKIVEIRGDDNPTLRTLCWSPLVPNLLRRGVVQDVALVSEALKEAMLKCSPTPVEGGDVVASIPEVQSFVRVLEVPVMSEREMDEAVQWAVRRHIPFDLDRVYIDWEELELASGQPQHKQVLVGAAQRDVVDPLLTVLDSLGFNVVALELEAQAVMRCLLPRDIKENRDIRGVLVIDLGATSTNVILFDQGAMRFTASIQVGGDDLTQQLAHDMNLSPVEAMEIKAKVGAGFTKENPAAAQALESATLNLARMVERAVQEMTVQLPREQRVRTILLTGGNANLVGIKELFGSVFTNIPVQYGNPWTNLQQEKKRTSLNLTIGDAMHFTTAIGLALRQVDY